MAKDYRVVIIEDDPYARDLMTLLLARDWRTRVLVDVGTEAEAIVFLNSEPGRVDTVIYDVEIPNQAGWPTKLVETMQKRSNPPAFLCTATCFDANIYKKVSALTKGGYLFKGEVHYTLAWGAILAANQHWVMTPGVFQAVQDLRLPYPSTATLINGARLLMGLTEREKEIARLAILLNMARRNLADELQISPDWAFEMVSTAYQKLGISEVLSGEIDPISLLDDNPLVQESFRDILSHMQVIKGSRKGIDMDTLAFHLLTVPDVQSLN